MRHGLEGLREHVDCGFGRQLWCEGGLTSQSTGIMLVVDLGIVADVVRPVLG